MESPVIRILQSRLYALLLVAVTVAVMLAPAFAEGAPDAVTTYSALTQKNTSAAVAPEPQMLTSTPSENVSKTSVRSLLPAGMNARIYAHFLTWFGTADHKDVGYSSADGVQVQQQISDMMSRGIQGAIVNWHGPESFTNQAALLVMAEAESHSASFGFAIEEDSSALAQCAATSGCDLAAKVANDLKYIHTTYAGAKTYMTFQNRPVIFLYGMEAYQLDWEKIRSSLAGNPVLVFRTRPAGATTPPARSSLFSPGLSVFDAIAPVSVRAGWELTHA